jgi:hypothetical protein
VSAADTVVLRKHLAPGVAQGQIGLLLGGGKLLIKKLEVEQ